MPMHVVDSHVHFWDPSRLHYPWLESVASLNRAFLPADYPPLAGGATNAVIFVEANCDADASEREVLFVEELAASGAPIAGIVAYVDLLDEARCRAQLARLRAQPLVVGVRHNIQGHEAGYCTQPAFVHGVQMAGEFGLPFDLCITHDQFVDAIALVQACPDTAFVLDHCGKPAIRQRTFDRWARDLARLAEFPGVHCKLSGLLTEADAAQRNTESLRPYAVHVHAAFGEERVLYGSDWPVVTLASDEAAWRAVCDACTAHWTPVARQRFFADNALRLYGIGDHAQS